MHGGDGGDTSAQPMRLRCSSAGSGSVQKEDDDEEEAAEYEERAEEELGEGVAPALRREAADGGVRGCGGGPGQMGQAGHGGGARGEPRNSHPDQDVA